VTEGGRGAGEGDLGVGEGPDLGLLKRTEPYPNRGGVLQSDAPISTMTQ
jgi:hypothetical protein